MLYRLALVLIAGLFVQGCARPAGEEAPPSVTLYSSVDDFLLREIVDDFEAQTGIAVRLVGDTEATKTTGLMHRLIAERDNPRADVWWSSEPFATERLAREGVLAPMPEVITGSLSDWPPDLIDTYSVGFATRARVIAVRAGTFDNPPTTLAELTDPAYKGRVGIARPEFGTTRGHVGLLNLHWGSEQFEQWLTAMKDNGLHVYSSNSAVVRAIAQGEILIALTDTDDVWAGQRNGWPVEAVYESVSVNNGIPPPFESTGPMLIPNTVALVAGGPERAHAEVLIEFLLSERAAERMAASDSHNIPVRPHLRERFSQWIPEEGRAWPAQPVADAMPEALDIVERVLGGP